MIEGWPEKIERAQKILTIVIGGAEYERIRYGDDAFADKPFGGNPAGVFPEAEGLIPQEMQKIARQLNLVERVFVEHWPCGRD